MIGWLARLTAGPRRFFNRVWRTLSAPFRWTAGRVHAVRAFFTEVPDDTPLTETLSDSLQDREAFLDTLGGFAEHINELRKHLVRAVIVLLLTTTLCFAVADRLMAVLAVPLADNIQTEIWSLFNQLPAQAVAHYFDLGAQGLAKMQVIEPTEAVGVFMRVSLLAGTALAMPWIVFEIYLFIAPGLYPQSRWRLLLVLPAVTFLFLAGLLFTYFVMLPTAVPFLETFMGFRAAWRPTAYFGLVTSLMFWVGVSFQLPLAVYALASVGLLKARQLIAQWRFAIVGIAVVAAVITPTTDPINMGLVMLPMILLYGVSIIGAWFAERGLRRKEPAA